MGFRSVKPGDDSLDSFRDYDRTPSKWVTVGPPGHPEKGWECPACGELRLRFTMERAQANAQHIAELTVEPPILLSQRASWNRRDV